MWWHERNIDPLIVARDLWQQSRERYLAAHEADLLGSLERETDLRAEEQRGSGDGSEASVAADVTSTPVDSGHSES